MKYFVYFMIHYLKKHNKSVLKYCIDLFKSFDIE